MTKITIEKYSEKYFNDIATLVYELQDYFVEIDSFKQRKPFDSITEAQQLVQQILEDVKEMNGVLFVASFDEQVVGFVQGIINDHNGEVMHNLTHKQSKDAWIGFLFVKPEFRSQNIGKSLIDTIKDFFKQNNCDTMRLIVSSDNHKAIEIYENYGFKTTDLKMSLDL